VPCDFLDESAIEGVSRTAKLSEAGTPFMSARRDLYRFIGKYSPSVAKTARASFASLRKMLPGANVLVYDNYNALAIAFSATDRQKEIVLSIALYPRWVSLFVFVRGKLPDPRKLLRGKGKSIRHVVLDDVSIRTPAVRTLISAAVKRAPKPLPKKGGRIIIKAISKKQRPRKVATQTKRR
jgi:hypothetical protein